MEYWSILLAILLIFLACYYLTSRNGFFQQRGVLHIKPIPFFGNMAPTFFRRMSIFSTIDRTYTLNDNAKYVGFMDFNTPVVVIRDRELVKEITVKSFNSFINHGPFFTPQQDALFGHSLLSMHDQKWRDIRAMMSPAFSASKMKGIFDVVSASAANYADYFVEQSKHKPLEVNTKNVVTRYATDVIGAFAFGVSLDSINHPDNDFYAVGREATVFDGLTTLKLSLLRFAPRLCELVRIRFHNDGVVKFFTRVLNDTIAMRLAKGISKQDLLQLMLEKTNSEDGPKLSGLEMISQAYDFFFAGFEVSSTLICFALQMIAEKSDIQKKLRTEIDEVFAAHDCPPPYDAISRMVYLEAVLNEVLRLYPTDPAHDRICNAEFELPPALPGMKPVMLRPGDVVWIPVYSMQRDPRYFSEPNTFNPERFISNGKAVANSANSLAFGQGPRLCIGNRLVIFITKVLIVHVLRKCSLRSGEKMITPIRLDMKGLTSIPQGGFWVEFQPRT